MLCLCCGQELFIDIAPTVFGEGGSAISMISPGYLSHLPHLSGKNQDDWLSIRIQDLRRRLTRSSPTRIHPTILADIVEVHTAPNAGSQIFELWV